MDEVAIRELPIGKEERIKMALDFIRSQAQNDSTEPGSAIMSSPAELLAGSEFLGESSAKLRGHSKKPKHTIRQIAMYFQIPKSTLYDRMKADQGQKRHRVSKPSSGKSNDRANLFKNIDNDLNSESLKLYSHTSQMKFSPETESQIMKDIQGYTMAYGNLPLIIDLKETISDINDAPALGNKWINSFMKRHSTKSVYGTDGESLQSIKFNEFKQWRNKFGHMHGIFLQQLQSRLAACSRFQYICKYAVRKPECDIQYIIFALDIELRSCDSNTGSGDGGEQEIRIEWLCEPVLRGSADILGTKASEGTDSDSASNSPSAVEPFLVDLDKVLTRLPSDSSLVILEGFTPSEHWSWTQCLEILRRHNLSNRLFTLPWGNHLLENAFNVSLEKREEESTGHGPARSSWSLSNTSLPDFSAISLTLADLTSKLKPAPVSTTCAALDPKEAMRQLLTTISQNESTLYRELQEPESRITLCDIFNKVRQLADSI